MMNLWNLWTDLCTDYKLYVPTYQVGHGTYIPRSCRITQTNNERRETEGCTCRVLRQSGLFAPLRRCGRLILLLERVFGQDLRSCTPLPHLQHTQSIIVHTGTAVYIVWRRGDPPDTSSEMMETHTHPTSTPLLLLLLIIRGEGSWGFGPEVRPSATLFFQKEENSEKKTSTIIICCCCWPG